jgi:hypothetical protein
MSTELNIPASALDATSGRRSLWEAATAGATPRAAQLGWAGVAFGENLRTLKRKLWVAEPGQPVLDKGLDSATPDLHPRSVMVVFDRTC